jgi:nitroreductase
VAVVDLDTDTVDRLLSTTRAVRKRLDLNRPVPADLITECVRLAIQAPSAADMQNWRWVAVTDARTRKAIGDLHLAADDTRHVRDLLANATTDAERRRLESALYLSENLHRVPVLVLAYALDPGLPLPVLYGSIFPAVWSLQLALRSRGLGSTLMWAQNEAAVNEVVGAPAQARIAALLPVAYYTGETFKPARRRPVEEVLYWERWEN